MYKYGVIVSESSVNKYNIFAYPLCFEIKNRRQGPKTAGYRRKPAAISNPVNKMLVMLLWVYIHTGQAWKIYLATVGIEPTTFGFWNTGIFFKLARCGYTLRVTSQAYTLLLLLNLAPDNFKPVTDKQVLHLYLSKSIDDSSYRLNFDLGKKNFLCVIQINTKFANFVRLYFPHFTTFRGQTLQFY